MTASQEDKKGTQMPDAFDLPTEEFADKLNALAREILGDLQLDLQEPRTRSLWSPAGTRIGLKGGQRGYAVYWFQRWGYAYTNQPDENGDYFAWTYKPRGEGARSRPRRWTAIDVVAFRHKGKAKARAEARYTKAFRKQHGV